MVAPGPTTQSSPTFSLPRQGADLTTAGVRYCTWAPEVGCVSVHVQPVGGGAERRVELEPRAGGFHAALDRAGQAGDRYLYCLEGAKRLPDPASRWQPNGVDGPSMVIDPTAFTWTDALWNAPAFRDLVIYELHVGTFTPEGTFRGVIEHLPELKKLGVRAIELLPIGDFPGSRNWGYDGVMLFAPARVYGTPDDLRALVDAAHAMEIAVILDVVYNHLGPHGNRLRDYSRHYFDSTRQTPWGDALHFDGPGSGPVRALFCQNVQYWIAEFHVDGFRLDATHAIHDRSGQHILRELRDTAHAFGAFAIAEDERNEETLLSRDGFHLDGAWADDFHHSIEASISDASIYRGRFSGKIVELVEILQHGWTRRPPAPQRAQLSPHQFICCISNHDQVGNRPHGDRLHTMTSAAAYRAASALLCLLPGVPMLFMGQEWAASSPFLYFTDHPEAVGRLVSVGRKRDLMRFDIYARAMARRPHLDPQDPAAFLASKLRWDECEGLAHRQMFELYQRALALRAVVAFSRAENFPDFSVGEPAVGVLAIRGDDSSGQWLLLFDPHGGSRLALDETELTATQGKWEIALSSNEARFGGDGPARRDPTRQSVAFVGPELMLLRGARS